MLSRNNLLWYHPGTWVSWAIRFVSTEKREPATHVNHAARLVGRATLFEAAFSGLRYMNIWAGYKDRPKQVDVAIFRRVDMSNTDRLVLEHLADERLNVPYPLYRLAAHVIDWGLTRLWDKWTPAWTPGVDVKAARWLTGRNPKEWECGFEVGSAYALVMKKLGPKHAWEVVPDDIWDAVTSDPAWALVFVTDGLAGPVGDAMHRR